MGWQDKIVVYCSTIPPKNKNADGENDSRRWRRHLKEAIICHSKVYKNTALKFVPLKEQGIDVYVIRK
jgi:hypothetical protein